MSHDWKLPWTARCRCERVELRITAPPLITMACHCTGCQRMTASAYSLSVAVPAAGFEVVCGDVVIGGLHGPSRHYHCAHCKSWLFTRPEGMDDMVNLRATMLEDRAWYAPYVEVHTDEGFAWAKTGATKSFGKLPAEAEWGPMIEAFHAAIAP
jgi:hypothetical protein